MVEYDKKDTIVVGGVEITSTSTRKEVENPIEKDNTIEKDEKMQFAERYFDDLQKAPGEADDFGRPSNIWTLKSDEIGTYANMDQLVGTYTAKVSKSDVYEAVGRTVYNDLTDGKSDLTVWFDGVETPVKTADVEDYVERNNTGAVNNTANGDLTEIYVDDDTNDVTIVTVRTYVFQAASDYDTRKETVSLTTDSSKYDTDITLDSRTLDVDDFANITDLKADDYVLVTAVNNNSRYEVKSIDKAEVVNGTVEGYKDGSNVTMGGTKYEYSATADNIKKTSYNVGREASLVLDSYGYVIAVDESVVLSDYVYIAEFGSSSGMTSTSRALANAIFPDGTTDEIVVDKAYDKKAGEQVSSKSTIARWGTDADQIGWFTYSKNSADEYTLYAVESKYDEEIASYSGKGTVSENSKVAPFENDSNSTTKADLSLANDETIVIVSDKNDDLYVYTGVKNFPAIELTDSSSEAAVSALVRDNGYAALIYIDIDGDATISGEQETTLVYVLSYDGRYVTTDNEVYHLESYREAKEMGLFLTAHAGEDGGADNIWDALLKLDVQRIDHGCRAAEHPELMEYLQEHQILCAMCPSGNVYSGAAASFEAHPLLTLLHSGVPVSISSDDPPYTCSMTEELILDAEKMGLTEAELIQIIRNGFAYSISGQHLLPQFDAWVERFQQEGAQ
jgi:hypothetical protein